MSEPKLLTKSKFNLALSCPTKLFYVGKREYANTRLEDSFLESLARGGFQVGELARCYFPDGIRVRTQNHDEALNITKDLLERENVIIFEAAFRHELLFVRADIVVKRGSEIELIEVKAKSCDFQDESGLLNKNGTIDKDFKHHVYDIAFQKYVVQKARPDLHVKPFLMLADKTVQCPTDGLNQKFRITKDAEGRKAVAVSPDLSPEDLDPPILRKIGVEQSCKIAYSTVDDNGVGFEDMVAAFAENHANNIKIVAPISANCKDCEFRYSDAENDANLRSGFHECWADALGWEGKDFDEPTVLDIWDFRRKDKLIEDGKIKMSSISVDDIRPKDDKKPGLSGSQRQWLQIEKVQTRDESPWIDIDNLRREMASWKYPLHFIDFEGSKTGIPFKKGRRPYEETAFQFSHHIVDCEGNVAHRGEFLAAVPGTFPNYDFVRMLKMQLETDFGTIFRYHHYENSVLCGIYRQLCADEGEITDREELCEFIKSITKSTKDSPEQWEGERNMVDLHALVKRYYYAPATNGSISIKHVLPAILDSSDFLKQKYSQPIYGSVDGILSPNFTDHCWVEFENGKVRDPYKLLPKLFNDESERDYKLICELGELDTINDGGAALTAYSKLQLQEMSEGERTAIEQALLKYCELDTLAMVMIYEAWKALI
jgi:uncharacterized protein DUF2779